jgi:hypothetical protein
MIVFYRHKDCRSCGAIEDALRELAIAHKVVIEPSEKELPVWAKLPVLRDEDKVVEGVKAIIAYLEELEGVIKIWYKYQSDVCYCNED